MIGSRVRAITAPNHRDRLVMIELGASPSWPSSVMPSTPAPEKKSVMRSMDE